MPGCVCSRIGKMSGVMTYRPSTAVRLGEHGTVHELAEGELFRVYISFYLPNTMDGDDTAELNCTLTGPELKALIEDLDQACARFPERK